MKKILASLSLALASSAVMADATLVYVDETGQRQHSYVAQGQLRVDASASQYMLFDLASETLQMVDVGKKSYTEMDGPSLRNLAEKLSGVQAQLETAMAGMEPEQRAQLEALGIKMPSQPPSVSLRSSGRVQTVNDWRCREQQVLEADKVIGDFCLAEEGALGMSKADVATMLGVQRFAREISRSVGKSFAGARVMESWKATDKVPVRMRFYDRGRQQVRTLESISSGTLDPALFRVPAGFTRESLPTDIAP